jgi:hypothetical protein
MKMLVAYIVCPALACFILWLRQGRFLAADVQIPGAILLGPISLLIALFVPRSMLTSREKSEGKRDSSI